MLSRTTAAALAIVLVMYLPVLPSLRAVLGILLLLVAAATLQRISWARRIPPRCWRRLHLALAAVAALLYVTARAEYRQAQQWPAAQAGVDTALTLLITSPPEYLSSARPKQRFDAALAMPVCSAVYCPPGSPTFRLSYYTDQSLEVGQVLKAIVRIWPPAGRHSPGSFDYERWLWSQGYSGTGYVREHLFAADAMPGVSAEGLIDRLRRFRAEHLDAMTVRLAGLDQQRLIRALLFADRRDLTADDWHLFSTTGTSHLMAISGMHLGILFAWAVAASRCVAVLGRGGRRSIGCAPFAGLLAALLYAAMAGFTLPTQRALLMLSVVVAALLYRRVLSPWRGFSLALLLVLLVDPFAAHSAGFALSFAAVAVLIAGFAGRSNASPSFALITLVRAQFVVIVGLLPLSLAMGFWVSTVSLPANLLAIPLLSLAIMPLLFLALLCSVVSEHLADVLFIAADFLLTQLLAVLAWLMRWSPDWQPVTSGFGPLVLALLVGVTLLPRGLPGRRIAALGVVLLLLTPPKSLPQGSARLTVLDVGQGLSVLVETRRHRLLYDVGPDFDGGFNSADAILRPYLRRRGINALDRLIISHGDRDHAGARPALQRTTAIEHILAGQPHRIPVSSADVPAVLPSPVVEQCEKGQQWEWDGVRFEILWPPRAHRSAKSNNASCVLMITTPSARVLLPGDIERNVEQALIASADLAADLLIAPHHGSLSSSSPDFVVATAPSHVVFSAGESNRYGHPAKHVVPRYASAGAQCWHTGLHGTLVFTLGDSGVSAPRRSRRRHFFWQREFGEMCANSPYR